MKKYRVATKKGQTVYHIKVNMRSEASRHDITSINKEGIHIIELKIVHQTRRKIALSDDWITILDRLLIKDRKESYSHYVEDVSIRIVTKETYFPNGIFATCYTLGDAEKCIKNIKKQIVNKVNKEYGFLFTDIGEKLNNLEVYSN